MTATRNHRPLKAYIHILTMSEMVLQFVAGFFSSSFKFRVVLNWCQTKARICGFLKDIPSHAERTFRAADLMYEDL